MATFAQWVKDQLSRDDAIGYFARYFDTITPGKVSSVGGVLRVLNDNARQYTTQPDGMEPPAWQRARAASDAAIAGYHLAVRAFHGEDFTVPKAETHDEGSPAPQPDAGRPLPLAQVPGAGPQLSDEARAVVAARQGQGRPQPDPWRDRIEARQASIEGKLETALLALASLENTLDKLLTAVTGSPEAATEPPPGPARYDLAHDERGLPQIRRIDWQQVGRDFSWQELFDAADHAAAEPEG